MTSAELWATELAKWSIPAEILAQAETSPWIHPPALFQIPTSIPMNPSHEKALAALPKGGSVLDIGCGGGLAAFALSENATKVIGVDHQAEMLEMFGGVMQDYLNVVFIDGRWMILAKMWERVGDSVD